MAITAARLWLDGELVDTSSVTLPIMGHAPQRGSLVFDVGSFHATKSGIALFRAREHVVRLLRSARVVGLPLRYDENALVKAAAEAVRVCGRSEGLVRWSVYYTSSEPDLSPRSTDTRVVVAAQLLEDPPSLRPIRVAVFEDARKAAPDVLPVDAKVAAAYLGPLLAKRRAQAAGADDVVLLDHTGHLAEAPVSNVFAVKNGTLYTPPLGLVLPGITRDAVLEMARDEGITIREAPLTVDAFLEADEAFLTGTSFPLAPIGAINTRVLDSAPGPLTRRLAERLVRAQHGEDPKREAWLTRLG